LLFIRRTFIKTVLVLGILLSPFIAGALPPSLFWPFFIGSSAITVYALGFHSERAKKLALVLASVALTITISDTALRFTSLVPDELVEKWPRMPLVNRYVPNLNYEGYRFNDLSRMAGVKEWREEKLVRLVTDSAGFRNERPEQNRPLDLILLGDSFGAGGVSQEYTWTSILARDYGLHTYNLSTPAAGPWHEYINLWAEKDRLKVGEGAVLIWQLFAGNDLDDLYGSLEVNQLPWRGTVGMWIERINKLRARSPLRYLLQKQNRSADVVDRDFLNGRKLLFYKPYIEASSRSPEEVIKHPHYARLRATILAVKRLAGAQGLRPTVVLVPAKEEVYSWVWRGAAPWTTEAGPSGFAAVLSDICAEEEIPFLDLKPYLVRESRRFYEEAGQLFYWYDDTHMSTVGNTFTTPIIYRELVQRAAPRLREESRARPNGGMQRTRRERVSYER
jgi:hypothetical protein